jgi:hypothetical protein
MQSEREKYIAALEAKLQQAGKAKRFVDSEDGAIVTEYLQAQINNLIKVIGGKTYINDHNAYVYDTGQLAMAQKLLNTINSTVDVEDINNRLTEARNDG